MLEARAPPGRNRGRDTPGHRFSHPGLRHSEASIEMNRRYQAEVLTSTEEFLMFYRSRAPVPGAQSVQVQLPVPVQTGVTGGPIGHDHCTIRYSAVPDLGDDAAQRSGSRRRSGAAGGDRHRNKRDAQEPPSTGPDPASHSARLPKRLPHEGELAKSDTAEVSCWAEERRPLSPGHPPIGPGRKRRCPRSQDPPRRP